MVSNCYVPSIAETPGLGSQAQNPHAGYGLIPLIVRASAL